MDVEILARELSLFNEHNRAYAGKFNRILNKSNLLYRKNNEFQLKVNIQGMQSNCSF